MEKKLEASHPRILKLMCSYADKYLTVVRVPARGRGGGETWRCYRLPFKASIALIAMGVFLNLFKRFSESICDRHARMGCQGGGVGDLGVAGVNLRESISFLPSYYYLISSFIFEKRRKHPRALCMEGRKFFTTARSTTTIDEITDMPGLAQTKLKTASDFFSFLFSFFLKRED